MTFRPSARAIWMIGAHDGGVAVVAGQAADEAAVDLQLADREPLQIGQARVAGAEVVDRQLHAEPRQRFQAQQRLAGVLHQDRLGQLQLEQCGGRPAARQRRGHAVDEVGLLELQRRDVDRDRQRHARAAPARRLAHRLAEHPVAERDDETRFLGHRDESRRRHLAQLGVAPAQQRLGADDGVAVDVDLRLVVQAKALRAAPGASRGRGACGVRRSTSWRAWWKR